MARGPLGSSAPRSLGSRSARLSTCDCCSRCGWRSLFFRTGLMGLLWLVPWLWLYPSHNQRHAAGRGYTPGSIWRSVLMDGAADRHVAGVLLL